MEREEIKKRFIEIFDNTDPQVLIETWYERSHDAFYMAMDRIKNALDEYYDMLGRKNPVPYIQAAYCFDGDLSACVSKIETIYQTEVFDITNDLSDALTELEAIQDVGIVKIENNIALEKSATLDLDRMDYLKFCLGGVMGREITGQTVSMSYDMMSQFTFELTTTDLDAWDRNWLSNRLYFEMTNADSMKDVMCDMTLSIWDMKEDSYHDILELKNALVTSFTGGKADDKKMTLTISCDWFFIADQDDDQVSNYMREELSNVAGKAYKGMKLELPSSDFNSVKLKPIW